MAINTASLIGTNRPWIHWSATTGSTSLSTGSCLSPSIDFASFREDILDAKRRKSRKTRTENLPLRSINYIEASEALTDLACENIFHTRARVCLLACVTRKNLEWYWWWSNSPQIRDNSEISREICHRQLTLELSNLLKRRGYFYSCWIIKIKIYAPLFHEINLHIYRDILVSILYNYNITRNGLFYSKIVIYKFRRTFLYLHFRILNQSILMQSRVNCPTSYIVDGEVQTTHGGTYLCSSCASSFLAWNVTA